MVALKRMTNDPTLPGTQPRPMASVSQEDRLLAAAAHLSVFLGFWLLGPIVIYAIKRKESAFVAFHALQAGVAHALFGSFIVLGFIVSVTVCLAIGVAMASPLGLLFAVVPYLAVGAWSVALLGVHAYAAYAAWQGRVWAIPLASGIARRILQADEGAARS